MSAPMLPTPPECGVPCATCEALAHDNARLRTEVARLQMQVDSMCDAEQLRQLRAEVERLNAACTAFSNAEIEQGDWRKRAEAAEAALATLQSEINRLREDTCALTIVQLRGEVGRLRYAADTVYERLNELGCFTDEQELLRAALAQGGAK